VRDGQAVVECRTIVTRFVDGLPLESPLEWAKMYRALGDDGRANELVRIARGKR